MKLRVQKICTYTAFILTALLSFSSIWNKWDNSLYDYLLQSRAVHKPFAQSDKIKKLVLTEQDRQELDFAHQDTSELYFMNLVPFINDAWFTACLYTPQFYSEIPDTKKAPVFSAFSKRFFPMLIAPADNNIARYTKSEPTDEQKIFLESKLIHPQFLEKADIPKIQYFKFPQSAFLNKFTEVACLSDFKDSDGITRKIPLLYAYEDGYLPSAVLYYMMQQTTTDSHGVTIKPGSWIKLTGADGSNVKIPVDKNCCMYVPYVGPVTLETNSISIDQLMQNSSQLDGTIVFISETLLDSDNYISTPFETLYPKTSASVFALNAFFTGNYIQDYPLWIKLIFVFVLLTAMEIASYQRHDLSFNLIYAGTAIAFVLSQLILWNQGNFKPWFWGFLACILISWIVTLCSRHLYLKRHIFDSDYYRQKAEAKMYTKATEAIQYKPESKLPEEHPKEENNSADNTNNITPFEEAW